MTIIDCELNWLSMNIAAVQEIRLSSDGSLREQDYIFFWEGKDQGELWLHGIGFVVRNSLLSMIEPPTRGSECILSTFCGPVSIMSISAATSCSSTEVKDQFYEDLDSEVDK